MKKELEDFAKYETRVESVKEVERQLLELYKDPELYKMTELLEKRGGKYYSKAACQLAPPRKGSRLAGPRYPYMDNRLCISSIWS